MAYVIKSTNSWYWGTKENVRGWGSRRDAKRYRSVFHALVDMAEWAESTFDREQPRIVKLRPKAARPLCCCQPLTITEAAIRADERARIARTIYRQGACVYIGNKLAAVLGTTALGQTDQLADAILAADWPAPDGGAK